MIGRTAQAGLGHRSWMQYALIRSERKIHPNPITFFAHAYNLFQAVSGRRETAKLSISGNCIQVTTPGFYRRLWNRRQVFNAARIIQAGGSFFVRIRNSPIEFRFA